MLESHCLLSAHLFIQASSEYCVVNSISLTSARGNAASSESKPQCTSKAVEPTRALAVGQGRRIMPVVPEVTNSEVGVGVGAALDLRVVVGLDG